MEKSITKTKFSISYLTSIGIIFFAVLLTAFGVAIVIKQAISWSFSLTGIWIDCISFLFLSWSWASPNPIIAWAGSGIDFHPDDANKVLLNSECSKYSLFKQPNRRKLTAAFTAIFSGMFLQAIGQTLGI